LIIDGVVAIINGENPYNIEKYTLGARLGEDLWDEYVKYCNSI
jgi:hypothetical protein